jgi:hypothetical protein
MKELNSEEEDLSNTLDQLFEDMESIACLPIVNNTCPCLKCRNEPTNQTSTQKA